MIDLIKTSIFFNIRKDSLECFIKICNESFPLLMPMILMILILIFINFRQIPINIWYFIIISTSLWLMYFLTPYSGDGGFTLKNIRLIAHNFRYATPAITSSCILWSLVCSQFLNPIQTGLGLFLGWVFFLLLG